MKCKNKLALSRKSAHWIALKFETQQKKKKETREKVSEFLTIAKKIALITVLYFL